MTKNLKRLVLAMCVLCLGVSCLGVTALAASDPMVAEIPVNLTLNGTLPAVAEEFTVQVTGHTAGAPMPAGSNGNVYEMKLIGNQKNVSGKLSIDFNNASLGIYEYTVVQIAGKDADCVYDSTVYNVQVYILNKEDMSGREMHVVITTEEDKPDTISFENRYADPANVVISAIKTLNGGVPSSNMFLFRLIDENEKVVQEVRNDKGTVTFNALVFDEAEDVGTHTYTLLEVDENAHSIEYDKSVYAVVVEVSKDQTGDYVAKVSYFLKDKPYEGTPTFANKQKLPSSPYTGDNLQILMWGGLMAISAFALIVLLITAKKKKASEDAFNAVMEQDIDSDLE